MVRDRSSDRTWRADHRVAPHGSDPPRQKGVAGNPSGFHLPLVFRQIVSAAAEKESATMQELTVVGGGLGGLTAAIEAAERGMKVRLFEARPALGGRARTTAGFYRA